MAARKDEIWVRSDLLGGARETFWGKRRHGAAEKSRDWRPEGHVPGEEAETLRMEELSEGGRREYEFPRSKGPQGSPTLRIRERKQHQGTMRNGQRGGRKSGGCGSGAQTWVSKGRRAGGCQRLREAADGESTSTICLLVATA